MESTRCWSHGGKFENEVTTSDKEVTNWAKQRATKLALRYI